MFRWGLYRRIEIISNISVDSSISLGNEIGNKRKV
jgi:hypothetical protein